MSLELYIKNLKLTNYRNYGNLDLDFSEKINIIYGDNAQGKTNILEAIFLCASGKSHRTQKFLELIQMGKNQNKIDLKLEKNNDIINVQMQFNKIEKRSLTINDIKIKKIGDLMGNLVAIFFSPDELKIIKGSPTERRRFIDITISQFKPRYFYALQQYNKIISQRNILLKEIIEKKDLIDTLDIWDSQLVETGSYIIKSRMEFIEKLNFFSNKKHNMLTNNLENLEIRYEPSFSVGCDLDKTEIEKEFLKKLKQYKHTDIKRGLTTMGPQRDDFLININNKDLRLYGSQGQQRTSVLAMKLAKIEIIHQEIGDYPVLLLDDVFSELDINRQKSLLESLDGVQTFITCTNQNIDILSSYKDIKFIKVVNGKICEN